MADERDVIASAPNWDPKEVYRADRDGNFLIQGLQSGRYKMRVEWRDASAETSVDLKQTIVAMTIEVKCK